MTLKCIGKDKQEREFEVKIEDDALGNTRFLAYQKPRSFEHFELVLKPLNDGSYMVMWADAGIFGGCGVPEVIIPYAAHHLSKVIHSSPSMSEDTWRIEAATKAWKRIVAAGKAAYNNETDTFHTT